jgi:hypothetical protein
MPAEAEALSALANCRLPRPRRKVAVAPSAAGSKRAAGSKGGGVSEVDCEAVGSSRGKPCLFKCGKCSQDADCVDPAATIRWAYKDGSGGSCWYCERVWCSEWCYKYETGVSGRQLFQKKLGREMDTLKSFQESRLSFVNLRKRGKKYMSYKRGDGVKKLTLKQKTKYTRRLIKQDDDFWPWDLYVKNFGDPSLPENRSRKHKKSKFNGIVGPTGQCRAKPFRFWDLRAYELRACTFSRM